MYPVVDVFYAAACRAEQVPVAAGQVVVYLHGIAQVGVYVLCLGGLPEGGCGGKEGEGLFDGVFHGVVLGGWGRETGWRAFRLPWGRERVGSKCPPYGKRCCAYRFGFGTNAAR